MTAIGGYVAPTASSDEFGIHSLDQFVLAVPDVNAADEFYTNFGLNMVRKGNTLQLKTFGHEHAWGSVIEGKAKALHHLSFGCFAEDIARLKQRIEGQGIQMEVKVAPKVSPDQKAVSEWVTVGPGQAAATTRAAAPLVRPRRLSHVLIFTSDVLKSIQFYERTLGLRLSDRASDLIAYMHGLHGSAHHHLALVKSSA